jgi:biotin operon repressor
MARAVERDLAARMLRRLRRGPVPSGQNFQREMGVHRFRSIGEHVEFLRRRGHRITGIAGGGYSLARSRKEAAATIRQFWSRIAEQRRTVLAMERGRVPQLTARATRRRVAA